MPVTLNDDDLINADQLAAVLGLSRHTIYALVKRDGLPAIKVSRKIMRFRRSDVAQWLLERDKEQRAS